MSLVGEENAAFDHLESEKNVGGIAKRRFVSEPVQQI